MANTMTLIEAKTLGSATASITFSSIPSTYTDLCIKISARTDRSDGILYDNLKMTFNGSSSSYSGRIVYGNNTTAASVTSGNTGYIEYIYATSSNATASTFGNTEIYIPNYAGSTNKSVSIDAVSESNSAATILALNAGLWSNTAAITSVTIAGQSQNIVTNSTFYLYGVKNA
jgi:hypothetical protein